MIARFQLVKLMGEGAREYRADDGRNFPPLCAMGIERLWGEVEGCLLAVAGTAPGHDHWVHLLMVDRPGAGPVAILIPLGRPLVILPISKRLYDLWCRKGRPGYAWIELPEGTPVSILPYDAVGVNGVALGDLYGELVARK